MADPLSLVASIIAVVGAAEGVTKTLSKIKSIRNAPTELLALINEVSDLRVILSDVQNYIIENTQRPQMPQENLQHIIIFVNKAKEKLLQLDELIHYRLTKPESVPDQIKISRREWARARTTIKKFQQDLRDVRLNIIAQMTVVNSSHQSRIGLTIDEIHVISDQLRSNLSRDADHTAQKLDEHSILLADILDSQSSLHGLLRSQPHSQDHPDAQTRSLTHADDDQSSSSVIRVRAHTSFPTQAHTSYHQRCPCSLTCKCACHNTHTFQMPGSLHDLIGYLFLGYSGSPIKFRRCTEPSCLSQLSLQIDVVYLFPSWLLTRAFSITFMKSSLHEISVALKFRRIVPYGSEIFRLTSLDDINGLRRLFSKGLASPNDINSIGRSALWAAIELRNYNTCRLLLEAGSDPWLKDSHSSTSPFDYAWNIIFRAQVSLGETEILRTLFPDNGDLLEDRRFSRLHKIVLGINFHDLREELDGSRGDIDATDSNGITPLAWAAQRGDPRTVKCLLEYRANPNIISHHGSTALLESSKSRNTGCLRLLIAAGANPASSNNMGSNAAHLAAQFNDSKDIFGILAAAGVNLNERRISDGTNPLSIAAGYNNTAIAEALIDYGASINILDNDGDSALHQSIYSHSDDVTQLLLSRGANHTLWDSMGDSILHLTAKSGGIRTLEILLAAGLHNLDPDALNRNEKTALQVSQERDEKPDGFVEKMTELLTDIRTRNADIERSTVEQTLVPENPETAPPSILKYLQNLPYLSTLRWLQAPKDNPQPRFNKPPRRSSSWLRFWILGLCLAGLVYFWMCLEAGAVMRLLRLVWGMLDPGEFEGF